MIRVFILLAFCLGLSGCDSPFEIFESATFKVNKAFPVNEQVRAAEKNLRTLIESDPAATKLFEEEYASRLEVRALTCAQGIEIGRFSSVETIRSLSLSRDCLNTQDALWLQFLGIRQVGIRLAQDPLRPLLPLGPSWFVPPLDGVEIYSADAAPAAGVAVLHGTRSELISIEIPGGKKIATLPTIQDASHRVLLSPNGRVAAVEVRSKGAVFIDTATGAKIFESKDIQDVLAWLPEISAALITHEKDSTLSIIDFKTGKIIPHPLELTNKTWALPVSSSPSRVLVGYSDTFTLIEHVATTSGIRAERIDEFLMRDGRGVTSSPPTLMLDGKAIFFITTRDFKMLNLESGKETFWKTGEFLANRYSKLSESTLLVDSYSADGLETHPWVFNIKDATLSPVHTREGGSGIIAELVGRTGFMRRGSKMWFGDELQFGAPEDLNTLLGAFNLERQLARLEAETRANQSNQSNQSNQRLRRTNPEAAPLYRRRDL